mmetsp:Transcript_33651/g.44395  ORF Transcript_33651/g.44395 Transcript_33651/m.44395 type:complete len:408 (-) Transcript_33651:194-1417(-)
MATAEEQKAKGNEAFKAQNWQQAIDCFTKAISLDAANTSGQAHTFYSNRSACYLNLKNASQALADAEECIKLKADWPRGYSRKGTALLELGRYKDAKATFKKGLEMDASNAELQRGLQTAESKISSGGIKMDKVMLYVKGKPRGAMQLLLRMAMVILVLLYLLPFLGRAFSFKAYRYFLYLSIFNFLTQIYWTHGFPKFQAQWLAMLMKDPNAHRLFLSFLLMVGRPNIIGIVPILLGEMLLMGWELASILPACAPGIGEALTPSVDKLMTTFCHAPTWPGLNLHQRWAIAEPRVTQLTALTEVVYGLVLILELLTPKRSFLSLILYWQFLQMRVMVEKADKANNAQAPAPLQAAFGVVDMKITNLTSHRMCPAMIGTIYTKVKGLLVSQTQLPPPGERPTPKCSIM